MANTIRYIDDDAGDHVFPVTHERAVVDSDGNTIEPKLQDAADMDYALMSREGYTNEQMQGQTKYNYNISQDGKWGTSTMYKHLRFSVSAGQSIRVKANTTNTAYVAMLKSGTSSSGGTPDYAAGWSTRETIPAGHTMRFSVPDDATLCYVYAGASSAEYPYIPESFYRNTASGPAMATKADKPTNTTEGNLAMFDAMGNLADSGVRASEYITFGTVQEPGLFFVDESLNIGLALTSEGIQGIGLISSEDI